MQRIPRDVAAVLVPLALLAQAACTSARVAAGDAQAAQELAGRIARIESGLLTPSVVRGSAGLELRERMQVHNVPAVSIAVIDGGRISWTRAYGELAAGSGLPVDTGTLFQAASLSKAVAAAVALRLVEEGQLSLDQDVNERLRDWKVPMGDSAGAEKVTLRRLLSHSAGTSVSGFPGYAAGVQVPTVIQVLQGGSPANTAAIRVVGRPGARWAYSGGGYTIAQLLMTEVTARSFPDLAREKVLQKAGMRHSTFEQPLPMALRARAARAHRRDGTPYSGDFHTYPEMAAAGLWTTPSDYARFAIEIARAFNGEQGRLLKPATVMEMLRVQSGTYGLGFSLEGAADSLWFMHGGSNAGFQSYVVMSPSRGQGAVVMTNGDAGPPLFMEILRSISREYGWNILKAQVRDVIALTRADQRALEGVYESAPQGQPPVSLLIASSGDTLHATLRQANWNRSPLFATTRDSLFTPGNPGWIVAERDAAGAVQAILLRGNAGAPIRLARRTAP